MSGIKLTLKEEPRVPLEAEAICPDVLSDLSREQIASQIVLHGKRQCRLDQFFDVQGEKSDQIQIFGDLQRVRWIGRKMTRGSIHVDGSVGMHLGASMKGGVIEVTGNAGDWVGAEMKHGFIRVRGNAGGQIGAAYRGSLRGMKNGMIIVDGSAGVEVGMRMRRGTIVVGKKVRDFAGLQMKGGTIVLLSGAEIRTGAWMERGTIISLAPLQLMPTFRYSCTTSPLFLNLLAQQLQQHQIDLPLPNNVNGYRMYAGDMSVPGKGEIFVKEVAA